MVAHASAAPTIWAKTKGTTDVGAIPANVSESVRARVTTGLAKLVEPVKKYAPVMYAPTANGAAVARPPRTTPKITSSNRKIATTTASYRPWLLRARPD